jgi:hypothetical protein
MDRRGHRYPQSQLDAVPEPPDSRFSAERVKHLEMIQTVIARLGSDSFLVKGWAVATTGVFLGFAVSNDESWLALPSVLVTAMFWVLDTYYLRSERLFRLLYDRVRMAERNDYEPFAMNATADYFIDSLGPKDRDGVKRRSVAFSGTILWLYIALALAAGVVAWVTTTQIQNDSAPQEHTSHPLSRAQEGR